MTLKRIKRIASILLVVALMFVSLSPQASAVGMNEVVEENGYEYTKYEDNRYSLDIHVEDGGWFGISGGFSHLINQLSNGLWGISRSMSNLTGTMVRQAYNLDLVTQFSEDTGRNIQRVVGVNSSGLVSGGLLASVLSLILLIIGFYIVYVGLLKRQTSKVVNALLSFVLVILLIFSFFAYAPQHMTNLTDFSSGMNTSMLNIGTSLTYSGDTNSGDDPTENIINSLWDIQVKKPWLILQFGTTVVDEDRVNDILSQPYGTTGREDITRTEVVGGNYEMSAGNVGARLGAVLLILATNLIISIAVIMLCAFMLLSELLFIIYMTVLPIVFIIGLLPNQVGRVKNAVVKVFGLLMTKTAIGLIVSLTFSISSVAYSLTANISFLFMCALQIMIFVGVFVNLGGLLSFIGIDPGILMKSVAGTFVAGRIANRTRKGVQRGVGKVARGVGRVGKGVGGAIHGAVTKYRPVKKADGSITKQNKDGSTYRQNFDGSTKETQADGSYRTTKPDGSSYVHNKDGSTYKRNADGSTKRVSADGSTATTKPDGSYSINRSDGTSSSRSFDGSTKQVLPDGSRQTTKPDGSFSVRNKDGSSYSRNFDGSTKNTMADGSYSVNKPDGSVSVYNKDGSKLGKDYDGTTRRTKADGSNITKRPDGSVSIRNKDGSSHKTDFDGSTSVRNKDGSKIAKKPDGSISIHNKDGSKYRQSFDGTTTSVRADGSNTTRKSDGSVAINNKDGSKHKRSFDGTNKHTRADGSNFTSKADGSFSLNNKDGSKYSHEFDGATKKVSADGSNITRRADDSVSINNKDGSKFKRDFDGTTRDTKADGSYTVTNPNGSTFTHNKDGSKGYGFNKRTSHKIGKPVNSNKPTFAESERRAENNNSNKGDNK